MGESLLDVAVAMDTDPGRKRKGNQDAIGQMVPADPDELARLGQLFVLADGVGGLAGGDLAAQYAVSTIISSYYEQEDGDPPERLARAIAEANQVIFAEGQDQETPGVMATTVVAAVIRGRELFVGSVGDSPAFLMRDANPRQLTMDHTVEAMQREAGTPLPEDDPTGRRLVRVLGSGPSVKVDIISGPVRDADHIVLCSDGLTRYVTPLEIERAIATLSPAKAVKSLIQTANERGGADNISVIVLRLGGDNGSFAGSGPTPSALEDWGQADGAGPHVEAALGTAGRQALEALSGARARRRARQIRQERGATDDNPLLELWQLLRGNTFTTLAALVILLVVFVVIMLLVANFGGDESPAAAPGGTEDVAREEDGATGTALPQAAATAQAVAMQTNDALQVEEANRAATSAALTLTPAPPSGPQMVKDTWFRVLDGDPVPAYGDASTDAEQASPLEAGEAYLIQEVNAEAANGPWYWVVDNLGAELRWVSGPSLHQRVVAISTSGDPLPDDQQPQDIAPRPGPGTPQAATVAPPQVTPDRTTPAPSETLELSPGEGAESSDSTVEAATPVIPYAAELWESGVLVLVKDDIQLRDIPSLNGNQTDAASAGETAAIAQGPIAADAHWWWQLRFDDGRSGWVAQPLLGFAG